MTIHKSTEMLETTEEQEHKAQETFAQERKEVTRSGNKLHPVLFAWLVSKAALFSDRPKGGDLVNHPEDHLDVRRIRHNIPQISLETAVKMAWLVWRAAQVQFWTRDLNRDTYAKTDEGIEVKIHNGVNTMTWEEALNSAQDRDGDHDVAFERRAEYYRRREESQEREESIALTLTGADGIKLADDTEKGAGSSGPNGANGKRGTKRAAKARKN